MLPSARGSSPRAPSSHAQHPSCLHRKVGLAPAEVEMHKKASFREPARQSGSRLAFQVRPPASDETPDSPQASCGERTRQHGCNRMPQAARAHRIWCRKLAAAQNGAPLRVQPRNELRRTARHRLHMELSERVKQKLLGACASRSDAAAPRYQIQGTRAPGCKGQQAPRPVPACAASILLAQKSRPCTRGPRRPKCTRKQASASLLGRVGAF